MYRCGEFYTRHGNRFRCPNVCALLLSHADTFALLILKPSNYSCRTPLIGNREVVMHQFNVIHEVLLYCFERMNSLFLASTLLMHEFNHNPYFCLKVFVQHVNYLKTFLSSQMHMFECVLDRAQDFVLTFSFSGSYFISMNRFAMDIPRNK